MSVSASFPVPLLQRCWFLAGPTASGKTAVGLELAARLEAEIVALDSMSLYRGMDIGTAKPDAEQRAVVPHHLVDIIEPQQEYSLAEYVLSARTACEQIVARGRTPLFVGGTALYLRSVLRGICEGPPADWDLRQRLNAEAERVRKRCTSVCGRSTPRRPRGCIPTICGGSFGHWKCSR